MHIHKSGPRHNNEVGCRRRVAWGRGHGKLTVTNPRQRRADLEPVWLALKNKRPHARGQPAPDSNERKSARTGRGADDLEWNNTRQVRYSKYCAGAEVKRFKIVRPVKLNLSLKFVSVQENYLMICWDFFVSSRARRRFSTIV